jgi:hypothetical protein
MLRSRGREQRGWGGRSEMNSIGVAFSVAETKKLDVGRGGGKLKRWRAKARGVHVAWWSRQASPCVLARTRSGLHCWSRWQRLRDALSLCRHCSRELSPSLSFSNYFKIMNRSQISVEMKLVQNFECYKTYLRIQSWFWMERDEFEPNSLKFKFQFGGKFQFELGQNRNSKITFGFSQ